MLCQEQGCGAVVKMTQLRLRSSSVDESGPGSSSGVVGFHDWSFFFHGSGSSSGFCSSSHINIFNWLGVPQVEWKMKYIKYTKRRMCQTFLSNLIWSFFTSSALTMRKSAKNQQSQAQTIQRTVSSRNESQNNDNINNFWKGSRWFCRQCLRTFCYFLRTESRKSVQFSSFP